MGEGRTVMIPGAATMTISGFFVDSEMICSIFVIRIAGSISNGQLKCNGSTHISGERQYQCFQLKKTTSSTVKANR